MATSNNGTITHLFKCHSFYFPLAHPTCPAPPTLAGQHPTLPSPETLALTSHGMDMPLHHRHLTHQQQNNRPPCPGACPCLPDAPQANPSHQGPLPCPQSPVNCRPTPCRTRCMRTFPRPPPPDQRAPEPAPTTKARATLPSTPQTPRPCLPRPARGRPCAPPTTRATRATTGPPHHPLTPLPPRRYKKPPLAAAPHHTTPPPLPHLTRSRRRAAGARNRAARPPRCDAAVVRLRRRHRHPGVAPTTLPHPQAAPEPLAAGRCLPWPSLPLPVTCPVGLEKKVVGRRSVDQRPRLIPACFESLRKLLSPGQFYV